MPAVRRPLDVRYAMIEQQPKTLDKLSGTRNRGSTQPD